MFGIDVVREIFENNRNKPILVYGDPDVDGLYAMFLVCQFLEMYNIPYVYYVNEERHHGFALDPSLLQGNFIIAVDFSIPRSLIDVLVERDITIISIDHHKIKDDFIYTKSNNDLNDGVVINNQYSFEDPENRYQSGAGVVYEVLCEIDPSFKSKERDAMVGITLLSDMRPIENARARKYLRTLYSIDTKDGYFSYLLSQVPASKFNFGAPRLDRNYVDFTLSPLLNSLFRFGRESEAINLVLGRGLSISSTSSAQRDLVNLIKERASYLTLSNLIVLAVDINKFPEYQGTVNLGSFIGLAANSIKSAGHSVLSFAYDNGAVLRASFRGKYDDIDYLQGFKNNNFHADGHESAFGIPIFNPTSETWAQLDDLVGELDENHVQTVKILDVSNLGMFLTQRGLEVATENCYVRDSFRTYLKYTGTFVTVKTETPKFIEYLVDGRAVKSFDKDLNFTNSYILPILEKGYTQLYLREVVQ